MLHTNRSSQQSGGHTQLHVTLVQTRLRPDLPGGTTRLRTPRALSTATAMLAPHDGAPRTAQTELLQGELRHEVGGLWRPSTTNFQSKNHQTCPSSRANQFRVSPLFVPSCLVSLLLGRLGFLSPRRADTKVVSTASWTPPQSGSPSATTSRRLASPACGTAKSMLRTSMFGTTRGPASLQMRAAIFSSGNPLLPSTLVQDGHIRRCDWTAMKEGEGAGGATPETEETQFA